MKLRCQHIFVAGARAGIVVVGNTEHVHLDPAVTACMCTGIPGVVCSGKPRTMRLREARVSCAHSAGAMEVLLAVIV